MNSTNNPALDRIEGAAAAHLREGVCLPFLRNAQNEDGGWGFQPRHQSRVEPTCWALQALVQSGDAERTVADGFRFLREVQLRDGSWPSSPAQEQGCWVTSLACWTLLSEEDSAQAVAAGLKWICDDWPRDSDLWHRLLRRLTSDRHLSSESDGYRGWGWTPRTSSWIEPTSFALIAINQSPQRLLPRGATKRRQLAEAMLYDRLCPGGGWNCGNSQVYGVPGQPLVVPTTWALLALRDHANHSENVTSLDWLERSVTDIQGPGSLALSHVCLQAYGRTWPVSGARLVEFYGRNEFFQSVPITAWVCLAWNTRRRWFSSEPQGIS